MAQVFMSYSRRDLAFVERLAKDLRAAGLEVWHDLSGLEAGDRWTKEIESAIRQSQYFVVVLSPNSVESEWVEKEFLYASSLKLKIVPLQYRPCELPIWVSNLNYIDVQEENYRRRLPEILKVLGVLPALRKLTGKIGAVLQPAESESELKQLESKAIRYELGGDFWNALQMYYQIKKKDPQFPRVDIKIRELEKEWRSVAERPARSREANRRLGPGLLVGIIGIAIIAAGIIGFPVIEKWFAAGPKTTNTPILTPINTQSPTSTIVPTLTTTLEAGPTVIATPTSLPVPSPTIQPEIVLLPGDDWLHNCITKLWTLIPITADWAIDNHNCLKEPVNGLATNNGALSVRITKSVLQAELYGIFTPLDLKSSASLDLKFNNPLVQSQLWVGVIDGSDLKNGIVVIYMSDGNFIREIRPPSSYYSNHNDENIYLTDPSTLKFDIRGNELSIPVNYAYTYSRGINYQKPYLFIGYLLLPGSGMPSVDVRVSNLQIINK